MSKDKALVAIAVSFIAAITIGTWCFKPPKACAANICGSYQCFSSCGSGCKCIRIGTNPGFCASVSEAEYWKAKGYDVY